MLFAFQIIGVCRMASDELDSLKALILEASEGIARIRHLILFPDSIEDRFVCRAEMQSVEGAATLAKRWGGLRVGANVYLCIPKMNEDDTLRFLAFPQMDRRDVP